MKGEGEAKVYYGCQLNGKPHLGTTTGLILSFSLANRIKNNYRIPTEVVFGALENGSGEKIEKNGIIYQKMLSDTASDLEGISLAEKYMRYFSDLLTNLSEPSGIPYSTEFYWELQRKPVARQTLLDLIAQEEDVVPLLNPSDDRLRIRFKCLECDYEEKHSKTLQIQEHEPHKSIRLEQHCFEHGPQTSEITPYNKSFIDTNTMVRNVMKEATIASESISENFFPLIVKGMYWIHASSLVSNTLELLGYSFKERPERIATPMIEDWSGAKFSKSVYVKAGSYDDLPEEFVSLEGFLKKYGDSGFRKLYEHVSSWVDDPKKFYRNYSIEYLEKIFNE